MLLVVPISLSDRHLIPFVERAFEIAPPGSGHQLLVVGSPNVMKDVAELAQKLCIHFAGNAQTHIFETDVSLGWPTSCNYYFQQIAFYLPSFIKNSLWFWFELDCTPLRAGWLDEVETACTIARTRAMHEEWEPPKFFGVRERTYQEFRGELVPIEDAGEHMAACGVYSSNLIDWVLTVRAIAATNIPWYTFIQWDVMKGFHDLPSLQNNWKTNSYERNADGKITCQSEANWAWDKHFNDPIKPSTVLVHGCKDGSLTELLRAEHELLKDEGIPVTEYWTDWHEESQLPQSQSPQSEKPEAPKKRRISQAQIKAARERLMKMHEAPRGGVSEMNSSLENLDEKGKPPKSRISDADKLYEIWTNLKEADKRSSYERARIDAAYDNEKPYSDTLFEQNGQTYRVNVSWGFAKAVLDTATAGYVDIINAVQKLFKCPTLYGNAAERDELESVVEEEVSNCIRSWRDFFPTYLRLCLNFIKHGVSVALPNDEFDWRFAASDLSDFKIPRSTKLGQENIEVACCLRYYTPTQLYRMIHDEDTAKELGYNVKAIRKEIMASVNQNFAEDSTDNWEKLASRLRSNDLYYSYGGGETSLIKVITAWVKEYDGKYSQFMISADQQRNEFLYKKIGRFSNTYQAFVVFTYGVSTNGEYHGVRGQGYDVFSINGALNIAYCQVLELATYGSAPTFQPRDESAMNELQFLPVGPYNLITPNVQVLKDSVAPNIAQNVLPVIQQFAQMFKDRTSQYNTEQLVQAGSEKTKFQLQAELGAIAKMTLAALNLFYDPFESLMREVIRRMKRKDYDVEEPGGEYIIGLHRRLLQRGAQGPGPHDRYLQAFYNLDVDRLVVMRAIGAGSEAARLVAFDRLMSMSGSFPDYGKQAILWDLTSETVGYRNAARYCVPPGENETPTVDASIAQLENSILLQGGEVTPIDGQNDFVHANKHLEGLMPMIKKAQADPNMLMQVLPGVNALNTHATLHVERLSMDPKMKVQSAQMRKVIQQADEVIHNGLMHAQKIQRQMAKAQGNGAPVNGAPPAVGPDGQPVSPSGIDPKMEMKIRSELAYREAQIQALNRESEAKLARQQAESTQKMAITDAENAQKMIQRR